MLVREATQADAAAIAHVRVAWQESYFTGLLPAHEFARLPEAQLADVWRGALRGLPAGSVVLVVEDDAGRCLGYAVGGPLADPELAYDSELRGLYVLDLPDRGAEDALRTMLLTAMAARLQRAGGRSLVAWGLDGGLNCSLFRRLGGVHLDEIDPRDEGGMRFAAYAWQDIGSLG